MNLKRIIALTLALALVAALSPAAVAAPNPLSLSVADGVNGLYVSTTRGSDFPSKPDLSAQEQKNELDRIVDFAHQYGFNTIYFEAISGGGAFYHSKTYGQSEYLTTKSTASFYTRSQLDPLDYLIKQADKQEIKVMAVIEPFLASEAHAPKPNQHNAAAENSEYVLSGGKGKSYFNPSKKFTQKLAVSAVKELAAYPLSGIVLKGFAYPAEDFELDTTESDKNSTLKALLGDIKTAAGKIPVGLQPNYSYAQINDEAAFTGYAPVKSWVSKKLIDFIIPTIHGTADSGIYASELSGWLELGVPVYTGNGANRVLAPVADNAFYDNRQELDLQLYLNGQLGASGCVIQNYSSVKDNFFDVATGLAASFAPQDPISNGFDLSFPQTFRVTRPTADIDWAYPTYYIMGTSDPSMPVTMGERTIPQSERGLFGVLVNLSVGSNTFTIEQGDKSREITINRYNPTESRITKLRQSSVFPAYQEGVRVGEQFIVSCIGPSGASVSAELEGRTIQLTQSTQADTGLPATFSAYTSLTGEYPEGETTRIGSVFYVMQYDGQTTTYQSNGELLAVAADAKFAIEVTDMRGDTSSINLAADFRDNMITSVEKGATDYVVGGSPSYYKLSCGGYIHKEDVRVLEGVVDIDNIVGGDPEFRADAAGETFSMPISSKPYYISDYQENMVTITFYNTTGMTEHFDTSQSAMFESITAEHNPENNSTKVTLKAKDGKRIWGYNVEFRDDQLVIFGKYTPKLSENPVKPLEGVVIVMDAGHGGNDPGALGVAGIEGPVENQLNYMNAAATALRLQSLGATVYQTQTEHKRLSYEERMDIARDLHTDFYISCHLNSTAETTDSTNAQGVEVYYNEELSIPFGEAIMKGLVSSTARKNRGVMPATFRVTQMTNTPSLLCELGYMVSPVEYDALCQPLNIYKAALGISSGVIEAIRIANAAPAADANDVIAVESSIAMDENEESSGASENELEP